MHGFQLFGVSSASCSQHTPCFVFLCVWMLLTFHAESFLHQTIINSLLMGTKHCTEALNTVLVL